MKKMITARDVAAVLRLRQVRQGREWRGACPACGYGTALVLTERDGHPLWWCASCRDREGVTAAIRRALGREWSPPAADLRRSAPQSSTTRGATSPMTLWDQAVPHPGTPAQRYLAVRALPEVRSAALRYHPRCLHPSGIRLPAMLAAVRSPRTGELLAVHRTFLRPDGSGKATAEPAKASLGPVANGAAMLHPPEEGVPTVIGEGIETALSAAVLLHLPVAWSALSCGNLEVLSLPPLPALPEVVIAADPGIAGQRAAWTAAWRWKGEGRRVRVVTPDDPGADFNDLLVRRAPGQGTHG